MRRAVGLLGLILPAIAPSKYYEFEVCQALQKQLEKMLPLPPKR